MKFVKTRDVKSPSRGTSLSAGLDFYVPNDANPVKLYPGHSALIPSGIRVRVPKGHALVMFNKSGVATKKSLQVGACVVDEDYTGEVHLHVTNIGSTETLIWPGDKLVQGIVLPVNYVEALEAGPDEDIFEGLETERGQGGFGSTGSR